MALQEISSNLLVNTITLRLTPNHTEWKKFVDTPQNHRCVYFIYTPSPDHKCSAPARRSNISRGLRGQGEIVCELKFGLNSAGVECCFQVQFEQMVHNRSALEAIHAELCQQFQGCRLWLDYFYLRLFLLDIIQDALEVANFTGRAVRRQQELPTIINLLRKKTKKLWYVPYTLWSCSLMHNGCAHVLLCATKAQVFGLVDISLSILYHANTSSQFIYNVFII